jgi:hypothetical protein
MLISVAAACGCASGPAATPLPGGPPAGSPTTAPAAGIGTVKSGALFDTGGLQWFEYRLTAPGENGKPAVSDLRFDYTTSVINGFVVKDDRITMKVTDPDMSLTVDNYYDPATDRQIGSQTGMVSNDITLSKEDVAAAESRYWSSDIAGIFETGDWPLVARGTEAVAVDGKTYTCTRFLLGDAGEYGTAWAAQGVPVPARIELKSADGTSTWELLGWG